MVTQLVCGGTGIHPQVLLGLQPTFLNTGLSRFMQGACLSLQLQLLSSPSPTAFSSSHTELLVLLGPHHATSYLPALAHVVPSAWHTCPPFPWLCLQTPAESSDTPFDVPWPWCSDRSLALHAGLGAVTTDSLALHASLPLDCSLVVGGALGSLLWTI